jgi:hypothetical protein
VQVPAVSEDSQEAGMNSMNWGPVFDDADDNDGPFEIRTSDVIDYGVHDAQGRAIGAFAMVQHVESEGEQFDVWIFPCRDGENYGETRRRRARVGSWEAALAIAERKVGETRARYMRLFARWSKARKAKALRTETIRVRCTDREKVVLTEAATRAGLTVSGWMLSTCLRALKSQASIGKDR